MIFLDSSIYKILLDMAKNAFPFEICGYILQKNNKQKVVEIENIADNKKELFFMNPVDQLRVFRYANENNFKFIATFHSHPTTKAYPSKKDILHIPSKLNMAYIIVSVHSCEIKAFLIAKNILKEERIIWRIR